MNDNKTIRLGLIGDNIAQSKAPLLHCLGGKLTGNEVTYDRLVPRDMGMDFDEVFADCAVRGFRGINITYPYKEMAARKVRIDDPMVQAMGAVNTVLFDTQPPHGHNTDYSGFIAAYRGQMNDLNPGIACMVGTGGVGRAVAFGLLTLGAHEIRLVDSDRDKADLLAEALRKRDTATRIIVCNDVATGADSVDGLINCTPMGMNGYEGTAIDAGFMAGSRWAFDAVYTPIETQFIKDAAAAGLTIISGYELFFNQGVDAWKLFTDVPLDPDALRDALEREGADT